MLSFLENWTYFSFAFFCYLNIYLLHLWESRDLRALKCGNGGYFIFWKYLNYVFCNQICKNVYTILSKI